MLYPIIGRSCSGKSTKIYELLHQEAASGHSCVLIVPEQFSYEAEKQVLLHSDPQSAQNIQVYSFRFLAARMIDRYCPQHLPFISSRGKTLLMGLAIDDLWDRLEVYGKVSNRQHFASELLGMDSELKQAGIAPNQLFTIADSMDQKKALTSKIRDIGLLLSTYNAYLQQRFSDSDSSLLMLSQILRESSVFQDTVLAVDGFSGFTADELSVLCELLKQAQKTYITFCLDEENAPGGQVFALPRKSFREIRRICDQNNIPVSPLLRLQEQYYSSELLCQCEKGLFDLSAGESHLAGDGVLICRCDTVYEECEWAAAMAKQLVQQKGYRYRDIAVIEGTGASYAPSIASAFRRFNLPVYLDQDRSITSCPVIIFLLGFIECAFVKVSTAAILRMLKSGMSAFPQDAINQLDNYLLMYDIDGKEWQEPWQYHPKGLGREMSPEAQKQLDQLNAMRAKIIDEIARFRKENDGNTIGQITKNIYELSSKLKLQDKLKAFSDDLIKEGRLDQSKTVLSSWNEWIECLSDLFDAAGERTIRLERYFDFLYELTISSHAGVAPVLIDAVTIGSIDRIRVSNKKAVIIVGVNDGVIPFSASLSGLFSVEDRREIAAAGTELPNNLLFLADKERYVVYKAFSYATDHLFVTYSSMGTDGSLLHPSEIILAFQRLLSEDCFTTFTALSPNLRIAGRESAFRYLASHFLSESPMISALTEYFQHHGEEKRIDALNRLSAKTFPFFRRKEYARQLYGDSLYFSPSRLETYYKCPFQYFCKYGLCAEPRKVAGLSADQNGLAVHYVLQQVFDQLGSDGLAASHHEQRKILVRQVLEEYIQKFLPGISEKSSRMNYILHSFEESILIILNRLSDEFANSSFVVCDTELKLNDSANGIAPYTVHDHTGGTVHINGTVDRVDMFEQGKIGYVRVVDYKTGGKTFQLKDVFAGLNMQMLIYLMCLWKNGENRYHKKILPAGVLYVPAHIGDLDLSRDATEKDIEKQNLKNAQMSGLLLNDPLVLQAMGAQNERNYLPIKKDKEGNYTGQIMTLQEFERLRFLINENIANMSDGIRAGRIEPVPYHAKNSTDACQYCDYRNICLREEEDPVRTLTDEEIQSIQSRLEEQEGTHEQ